MFFPAALVVASLVTLQHDPRLRVGLVDLAHKFEIEDGDRIVWIGNTLVEREQRYGYWETALHAAFPDKQFTLRNLGWSGDTVHGDARAGFENAAKGFERLVSLTLELKPTVIFVSYGTNESFEGEAGLPKFEKGLEKLLDALKPSKARVVLFSPMQVEAMPGRDSSAVEARNATLQRYGDAVKGIASRHCHNYADLFSQFSYIRGMGPYMDNGIHLTAKGYKLFAHHVLQSLAAPEVNNKFRGELAEPLRLAIVAKNELFFHRWRPENETYLLGFRKHEQGNNAVEIKQFEPLVAKAEDEIEKIRKTLKK